jgi:hypothetical protein
MIFPSGGSNGDFNLRIWRRRGIATHPATAASGGAPDRSALKGYGSSRARNQLPLAWRLS